MQGLPYHQPCRAGVSTCRGIILSSIYKGMDKPALCPLNQSIRTAELTRKRSRITGIRNGVNWKRSSYTGIKLYLVGSLFRVFQVLWALDCCQLIRETIFHSTLSHNKALIHSTSDSRGQTRHCIHEIIPKKETYLSKEALMSPQHLFDEQWSRKTTSEMKHCVAEIGKVQSGAQLPMLVFW